MTNGKIGSGDSPQSDHPTRVRWHIMFLVMAAAGLTYIDRVNLSIAGQPMQLEMHFSTVQLGWIFGAFQLGYALTQVPGGWAADWFGPRRVLTVAILWWSVFTAMTGFVPNLPLASWMGLVGAFILVRFMVGVGEAPNAPTCNKIIANWMGSHSGGVGASFIFLGTGLGAAVTPPLISWIMVRWGWRVSFYLSGLMGVAFAILWYFYVRNNPEQHRRVNQAELRLIAAQRKQASRHEAPRRPTPWRKLLRSRSVWGLLAGYFCQAYPIYFFFTWLFIYLVNVRGLSIKQGGTWGMLPYLSIALLSPFGGVFSDFACRRLGKTAGRRSAVWLGLVVSALFLWLGSRASNGISAVLLLSVGSGASMFAATTFWATCVDLTLEFTGSLSGLMNMCGNLGGWLSPIVTAYVATRFGWQAALDLAAGITIVGAVCFTLVNAGRSLDEPSPAGAQPPVS